MKNVQLKKSDDSWIVREVYDVSGATVWRSSSYDKLCRAVLNYIKLRLKRTKSK